VRCSLLTTIVLGSLNLQGLAALRSRGNILEELTNPLREILGRSTLSNESDVRLGVNDVGVASNVLLVQVLLVGSRGSRIDGGTQTDMEGDGVSVVEGESVDIGIEGSLLEMENSLNILVELVGYGIISDCNW
jgi:hypothetical protein